MFRDMNFRKFAAILVTVFLLLLSVGTFAFAQSGGGIVKTSSLEGSIEAPLASPVPGGPAYVAISPFDFTPWDMDAPADYDMSELTNPNPVQAFYVAPIHVPNGVTITKIVVHFKDNSDSSMRIFLDPCPYNSSGCNVAVMYDTVGKVSGLRYAEIAVPQPFVVDLASNTYALQVQIPGGQSTTLSINGIRVDYGSTVSLPAVLR